MSTKGNGKIEYGPQGVDHFNVEQQWMAAELADNINAVVYMGHMTVSQTREVLRFLLAQLEGK